MAIASFWEAGLSCRAALRQLPGSLFALMGNDFNFFGSGFFVLGSKTQFRSSAVLRF
jgi:hypothetical protein